jgi:hypothetical protein
MIAVHFLQENMKPRNGHEKPWVVGEKRTKRGQLAMCARGYHFCPTWEDAIRGGFLYGPIACIVEVDDDAEVEYYKGVSRSRKLLVAVNVEREMRLFAADEAARALRAYEKRTGMKADPHSWAAVKAARDYADQKITATKLAAAKAAAWDIARGAARGAAGAAAWDAAWAAAWDAAQDAAGDAAWDAAWKRFSARMAKTTGWKSVRGKMVQVKR